jgi:hypothetical protein
MKQLFAILLLAAAAQSCMAGHIANGTLRELIEQSHCIVVATVEDPEKVVRYYDDKVKDTIERVKFSGDGIADLHIQEVLKGKPYNSKHVQVAYDTLLICPAPAQYFHKQLVIAFLAKRIWHKTYFTVGFSSGVKSVIRENDLRSYRDRILSYLEILKIKNKQERAAATLEWLVACTVDHNTRIEGYLELSKHGRCVSYYDRFKHEHVQVEFTISQSNRIDSAFFAKDTMSFSEFLLVDFVSEDSYPRLKQYLLKNLLQPDRDLIYDIMQKFMEISPSAELQSIFNEWHKVAYLEDDQGDRQIALVEKFIKAAERL